MMIYQEEKIKNEQLRNYPNSVRYTDGISSKAGKGACSRHGGVAR
jgi:hypothetical protein